VVDGTGVSMPDTPENQRKFPQPSTQRRGCGFPVAKLVGCFCLGTGTLIEWAEGTLKQHEHALWAKLRHLFVPQDILLADRGFCSYQSIGWLQQRGVDSVMRLHQARKPDFRKGKRIGPNHLGSVDQTPPTPSDNPLARMASTS
jgi:hypothetical protein